MLARGQGGGAIAAHFHVHVELEWGDVYMFMYTTVRVVIETIFELI